MMPTLTREEKHLLAWLAKEDSSALGECHGPDLDRLVKLELAEIGAQPEGMDPMFRRVRLTPFGWEVSKRARP